MRGQLFLLFSSTLFLVIPIVYLWFIQFKNGLINLLLAFVLTYIFYLVYFSIPEGESTTKWLFINLIYSWTHSFVVIFFIVQHYFGKKETKQD